MEISLPPKAKLKRIVAMLTRLALRFDGVVVDPALYNGVVDYEHRFAEHEHDLGMVPEQNTKPDRELHR